MGLYILHCSQQLSRALVDPTCSLLNKVAMPVMNNQDSAQSSSSFETASFMLMWFSKGLSHALFQRLCVTVSMVTVGSVALLFSDCC